MVFSIREKAFLQGEFFFANFVGVPRMNSNLNCGNSLPKPLEISNPRTMRKKNPKRYRKINDPDLRWKRKNLRNKQGRILLYQGIQR
ncbi:hypothetical protein DLM75_23440 [Leptospira stimsonii]|uniref:Uncharacterized protein n=1 Tax=Leptospira stimsonii TaxID=2202203 RepID=A0A396YSV6_9LEPT|nr:hypothetical protein DLM75_23440 [Leptospira stimsonii]